VNLANLAASAIAAKDAHTVPCKPPSLVHRTELSLEIRHIRRPQVLGLPVHAGLVWSRTSQSFTSPRREIQSIYSVKRLPGTRRGRLSSSVGELVGMRRVGFLICVVLLLAVSTGSGGDDILPAVRGIPCFGAECFKSLLRPKSFTSRCAQHSYEGAPTGTRCERWRRRLIAATCA
jgi:hypothetical protein